MSNELNAAVTYHRPDLPPEQVADVYDRVFDNPDVEPGDWYWGRDEAGRRVLWLLVPDLEGRDQGTLTPHGVELLRLYARHASKNWAQPGSVNGWDGNEEAPTLRPSILVPDGWHGFLEAGKLRAA